MMRRAITALLLMAAQLTVNQVTVNQAQAKTLWILPNHRVRFDNGPELNSFQFRIELKRMNRSGGCPPLHVSPAEKANYATVAHVLKELSRSGCHKIGFTGEEQYIQDK